METRYKCVIRQTHRESLTAEHAQIINTFCIQKRHFGIGKSSSLTSTNFKCVFCQKLVYVWLYMQTVTNSIHMINNINVINKIPLIKSTHVHTYNVRLFITLNHFNFSNCNSFIKVTKTMMAHNIRTTLQNVRESCRNVSW